MLLFTRCGAAHRFRQAIGCRASHTDGHEPATRCVKASAKKRRPATTRSIGSEPYWSAACVVPITLAMACAITCAQLTYQIAAETICTFAVKTHTLPCSN